LFDLLQTPMGSWPDFFPLFANFKFTLHLDEKLR
jgi:hypothetical protein